MADSDQVRPVDSTGLALPTVNPLDQGIVRGRLLAAMFGLPAQHQEVGRYVVLGKLG